MVVMVGVLTFSIAASACSWAIGKRARVADRRETSASVLLTSCAAFLSGMFIMRFI